MEPHGGAEGTFKWRAGGAGELDLLDRKAAVCTDLAGVVAEVEGALAQFARLDEAGGVGTDLEHFCIRSWGAWGPGVNSLHCTVGGGGSQSFMGEAKLRRFVLLFPCFVACTSQCWPRSHRLVVTGILSHLPDMLCRGN